MYIVAFAANKSQWCLCFHQIEKTFTFGAGLLVHGPISNIVSEKNSLQPFPVTAHIDDWLIPKMGINI